MKRKTYLIVLALLVCGLSLNQVGSAKESPESEDQFHSYSREFTLNFDDDEPGSVKPPSGKSSTISTPGTYSIGGVCVLRIRSLGSNVTLSTQLIGLNNVGELPKDWRFLAGICHVSFFLRRTPVSQVTASQAAAEICFATIPNSGGLTRVYTGGNQWITLGTINQNGESCSPATISGDYLFAGN